MAESRNDAWCVIQFGQAQEWAEKNEFELLLEFNEFALVAVDSSSKITFKTTDELETFIKGWEAHKASLIRLRP